MKKNYYFTMVMLLAFSFINLYSDCKSSPDPEAPFIPNISNEWRNVSNAQNNFFFFRTGDTNKENITGNVNLPGVLQQAHVEGRYENTYIEFAYVDGPFNGKKYTGNFDRNSNPLKMTVKSGAETLTLERQP